MLKEPCAELQIESAALSSPSHRQVRVWVLVATILGSSLAFIDGTVVNVALPALQHDFHASVTDVQWVVEIYSLLLSTFLLIGGALGDHYGRRRIFVLGVLLFAAASGWCGLALSMSQLLIARGLQGLGASLLVPGSLAIISSSFATQERGRAIGTWSGFSAITTAIGPVLGGWLVEKFSWRAAFFLNLPLALIVVVICYWRVPESVSEKKEPLDWLGTVTVALGLGILVAGLIESSRLGFNHPAVWLGLIGGLLLLALFVFIEAKQAHPLMPLQMFRSTTFAGANLLTLLLYSALGGTFFFLPLNLIQVQHYSPSAAGAAILPLILIIFLLSRWSGGLLTKYGAKLPLMAGPLIAALGYFAFAFSGIGGRYWVVFLPALILLGLGMAISVAPLTTAVMTSAPAGRVGIASGINNAASRVAGLLAIAVFGIIMLHVFRSRIETISLPSSARRLVDSQVDRLAAIEVPTDVPVQLHQQITSAVDQAFSSGFRVLMFVSAGLAVASAAAAYFLIASKSKIDATQRS